MTNKTSTESRRKLLKSIAAGSGAIVAGKSLPESWSRPVVDSVMLPAHAQTSGRVYSGTALMASIDTDDKSMMAQLMDSLVPEAKAGWQGGDGDNGFYASVIVAGDMADVTFAGLNWWCEESKTAMIRQGLIPIDGAPHTINGTSWARNCDGWPDEDDKIGTFSVDPSRVRDTQLFLTVHTKSGRVFSLNLPATGSPLPVPPLYDCDNDCNG